MGVKISRHKRLSAGEDAGQIEPQKVYSNQECMGWEHDNEGFFRWGLKCILIS